MASRVFGITVWISKIALAVTLLLFVASLFLNPLDHRVSLGSHFHVGVWKARLVFFNVAEYGPYLGSIIAVVDDQGNVYPRDLKESGFGDVAGIYYRHFLWEDSGTTLWTLMVSLLYPIGLFAILPVFAAARNAIRNRDKRLSEIAMSPEAK